MLCKENQKQTQHSRHAELCSTEVTLRDGRISLWRNTSTCTNELLKTTEMRAFVIRKHEGTFSNFFMKSKIKQFNPRSIKLHVPS